MWHAGRVDAVNLRFSWVLLVQPTSDDHSALPQQPTHTYLGPRLNPDDFAVADHSIVDSSLDHEAFNHSHNRFALLGLSINPKPCSRTHTCGALPRDRAARLQPAEPPQPPRPLPAYTRKMLLKWGSSLSYSRQAAGTAPGRPGRCRWQHEKANVAATACRVRCACSMLAHGDIMLGEHRGATLQRPRLITCPTALSAAEQRASAARCPVAAEAAAASASASRSCSRDSASAAARCCAASAADAASTCLQVHRARAGLACFTAMLP